jgi:hypothetical protein
MLKERDTVIGRQGQELGQLRDYVLAREQAGQRPPQKESTAPEFSWEDPVRSVEAIVSAREAKLRQDFAQARLADIATRTTKAFVKGQRVFKENPQVFDGIEKDVSDLIVNVLGPQARQGYDVSDMLEDPETWETAALYVRKKRGELDKFVRGHATKGMAAGPADVPSQTKTTQDDDGIIIEDSDRREYEELHGRRGTDKEIREMIKLGLETPRG